MELLALLSDSDDVIIPNVKKALQQFTVYPLKTLEELEELYSNIPLNLFLIDSDSHKMFSIREFLNKLDENKVVLITREKPDKYELENLPGSVFDCVDAGTIMNDLPVVVKRALERQRFESELRMLKQARDIVRPAQAQVLNRGEVENPSGRYESVPAGKYIHEKVIVNFARMLTVSFDMRKLLDHFIDSVMEIARVSKMSVMLKDKSWFHVRAQYGLDPYIADNIKLGKDSALASWLTKTGRILHKPVTFVSSSSVSIAGEMEALQCLISFPMIYKGKLIGIFNIDNKVTEEPFYREELEIIYVLCNYLAAAVKDVDLYHQMWYQKEFTNNILSSMSSGMIAIDKDEKITVFNQRASEVLNLDTAHIIGSDLRALPSPLGDILYETMVTGKMYKRFEVIINPAKLPLGINSYRLIDEERNAIGAGIVFSDLSDSKKLEEQRNKAEKLRAVNDLMAKIAHEVRNPLTSIQTFTQLLNEKYADDDLNKFYISTVSQSIRMLDSLIDKLVTFSSSQNYNFDKVEINDFINEAAAFISKNIPETHKFSKQLTDKTLYINIDRKNLIKSVYYLVLSIIDRTPDGTFITMNTNAVVKDVPSVEIAISYTGDELVREGKQDLLKPLLDIKHLGTELNIPISHKIIEGHDGSLDIKSGDGVNSFIIKLPILDRRTANISIEGGRISG
ncbi:MAG: PAS domain-containing protein [Nitrospirae bacterium]|nr:PAS domain-containing protein [Nitrospirota bacterium]